MIKKWGLILARSRRLRFEARGNPRDASGIT